MKRHDLPLLLLAATCVPAANAQPAVATEAACQVWQRELSFAHSVQQHDRAAFAAHLANDAVFDATTATPTRGRAAIVQHWVGLLDGKMVKLRWYPHQVVVSGRGTLAYSSGPYLVENRAPNAQPRYTTGHFATTWARGSDGVWRVAFDAGDEGKPADKAAVDAFEAGRRADCPLPRGNG
ncbi:MAG: DUF4440 domain-containing protein [Rhodanobacter sp.]